MDPLLQTAQGIVFRVEHFHGSLCRRRRLDLFGELPEPARHPEVEQYVQQGYLARLAAEHALAERLDGEPAEMERLPQRAHAAARS